MKKIKKISAGILSFLLPVFFCFICFFLVWYQYLQDVPEKSQSQLLNDRYDSLTTPFSDGDIYTQHFTINGKLNGLGLNFNVVDTSLDGDFFVKLTNTDTGELLMDYQNILGSISTTSYTCMMLDLPLTEEGKYNLELSVQINYKTPDVSSGQKISLRKSSTEAENFGTLQENSNTTPGSLAILVISDIVGNQPIKYYWTTCAFASISCGLLGVLFFVLKKRKAIAVFFTLFFVSLMYHAVLPTHSAPDETTHHTVAYRISNKWLGIENEYRELTLKRECDNKYTLRNYNTTAYTYRYMMNHLNDSADFNNGENLELSETDIVSGYKVPYYLSAGIITLCRQLHINGVVTTYLARIPNTIFYCLMITLAWYLAPFAKTGFLALGLLPISIHIGTSLSYDSFTIALAFVLTALCLNIALSDKKAGKYSLASLAIVCIIIAPMKSVYILLPLLVFIIPDDKFSSRKAAWIFRIAVILLSLLHYGKYNLWAIKGIIEQVFSAIPGKLSAVPAAVVTETATIAETTAKAATVSNFSISFVLSHPGVLFKLIVNTLFEKSTYYFETIIGGYLGYLNLSEVKINSIIIIGFAVATAFAFIPEKTDKPGLKLYQRAIPFIIASATLAALIVVCITWTPMDYDYIWGFQGRYLLPVLPSAFISLHPKKIQKNGDFTTIFLCLFTALNVLTVLNSFIEIFAR